MNLEGFAVIPRHLWHDESVPPHAKLVYVTLTSYAGPDHSSWPSHATIAKVVGISVSSVQRALRWLEDHGHVTSSKRVAADGGQSSNLYRIHTPPIGVVSETDPPVSVTDPPGQCDRRTRPIERTTTSTSAVDDEVLVEKGETAPAFSEPKVLRYEHSWTPSAVAVAAVCNAASELVPDEHLDHYLARCSELGKKPSGPEWVRWFMKDQNDRRAADRLAARNNEPQTDDSGVPLSWK